MRSNYAMYSYKRHKSSTNFNKIIKSRSNLIPVFIRLD
nr:MAG TPA: hypothetical protein [Crassvirales sp.]